MHESRAICELQDRRYLLMLNNAEIARKVNRASEERTFFMLIRGQIANSLRILAFLVALNRHMVVAQ